MIILEGAIQTVPPDWGVCELTAPGFSRFYYILSGDVTYMGQGITKKLEVGSLYLFPSTVPYRIIHDKDNPLRCLWAHLDVAPSVVSSLESIIVDENTMLSHLLCALEREFVEFDYTTKVCSGLAQSFEGLFFRMGFLSDVSTPIRNALNIMRTRLNDPSLSVGMLAETMNMSPEHFIRLFKKNIGCSPYKHILFLRMRHASVLLHQGVPVQKVAVQVGYEDARVFAQAFKHYLGVSPAKFSMFYSPYA